MSKVTVRMAQDMDYNHLVQWLSEPEILKWFPLNDKREIDDAARIWMSYIQQNAVLTAEVDGSPCGTANLYIQPFKKLAHQCLFAIIVDGKHRGKGVGTVLLENLIDLARNRCGIEILHLEVYEGNPAIRLYERFGFSEYGRQNHFVKEDGMYRAKILMQKRLVDGRS